jgi:hypothetical protein
MKTRANTKSIGVLALATLIAAVAIPAAAASGSASDPGLVARQLGSPDPRENVTKTQYAPGRIASRLGSPDPRDTGLVSTAPSAVASTLGSPDPREAAHTNVLPSAVATTIGSPDPQDAALLAQSEATQVNGSFDWGDFAIGLAFGTGLAAIVAGVLVLTAVAARGRSVAQPLS